MAARKRLRLGNSDFKSIMESDAYFVDKTLFIREVIETEADVLLIPRPRRFGKTMNLSMLRYYFDKNQPGNEALFKSLKIWQTASDIKRHCCRYPVIYISFKDAKAGAWRETFDFIKVEIAKAFKSHRYLLDGNILFPEEKRKFENIITETGKSTEFSSALIRLSEYLYRYHNEKVVILIDEYDTPIQTGYRKFYDEVVSFMRNLLSGAFKDNSFLYKGVITGILRVSKESIFSGLNNLDVYSILNYGFSDKFGFTQQETDRILEDFNLTDHSEGIRKWYNGYRFGNTGNIYNPWSILNYVTKYREGFRPYWTRTSTNELIKREIKKKEASVVREEIMRLINGESINEFIEENFVFPELDSDIELLWTLLLFSGYLTVKGKKSSGQYELCIPNYELKTVFKDTVLNWLRVDVKIMRNQLEETTNFLIKGKLKQFEEGFRRIMGDTLSYYDTAAPNEYVYHSYLLGLLAILGDDYIIKSNRESGSGRYDIMLIPHDRAKNGVVIEIKTLEPQHDRDEKSQREKINRALQEALDQIEKHEYYKELTAHKIPEKNIIKVPVVFVGKNPYVLKIEKSE